VACFQAAGQLDEMGRDAGECGVSAGTLPTDADIDRYFTQVENELIAR